MGLEKIAEYVLIGGGFVFYSIIIFNIYQKTKAEKSKEMKYIKIFKDNEDLCTDFFNVIVENELLLV